MSNFTVQESLLVSVFLESILYGLYLVTIGYTIRFFIIQQKDYWTRPIHYVLACTTALLAVLVTLDVLVGFRQAFIVFLASPSEAAGLAYLEDITNRDSVYRNICTPLLGLIPGAMLVYRCGSIYKWRPVIIIPPILFWIAYLAMCIVTTTAATVPNTNIFSHVSPMPFLISAVVMNVFGSALATGLIAYFLYMGEKETQILYSNAYIRGTRKLSYSYVMRIIIESGLLITLSDLAFLVAFVSGSNADNLVSIVLNVVYAIAFNLIIIRAHEKPPPSTMTSSQVFVVEV